LAKREADIAIRNVRPKQKSLFAKKILSLGGCAYASSMYLASRGAPRDRNDVAGHDIVVYETPGGMPGFEWLKTSGARIAFRAADPAALVGAASAGLGICAVPCLLGDAARALERVPALGFAHTDLYAVIPEAVRRTARVRAVLTFIADVVERHRA